MGKKYRNLFERFMAKDLPKQLQEKLNCIVNTAENRDEGLFKAGFMLNSMYDEYREELQGEEPYGVYLPSRGEFPKNNQRVLCLVEDDNGEKYTCIGTFEMWKDRKYWDFEGTLATIHGGLCGKCCSNVIKWREIQKL